MARFRAPLKTSNTPDLGSADFIEKPFAGRDFVSRILSLVEETAIA
jgi:hypothetical protein